MTEKNVVSPEIEFDLDAWMSDAVLPMQSADVFKAGVLPAEASALKKQIEIARDVATAERSAADKSKIAKLEARYAQVLREWMDSKITVYVSALSPDQMREMRAQHEKDHEGKDPKVKNELYGYDLLAAAIVGIAEPGNVYTKADGTPAAYAPVKLRPNQVRGLERKIGATQMQLILNARATAQNGLPEVDADFLLESSGTSNPGTDD